MDKKLYKSYKKFILKYSQNNLIMITIKCKVSIKIHFQIWILVLTPQVGFPQQIVAPKLQTGNLKTNTHFKNILMFKEIHQFIVET